VPADTPRATLDKIDAAFANAMKNPSLRETLTKANQTMIGAYGDESMKILSDMEKAVSWALFDLGAAKISPDSLGIPRP
jgi:tripartite-type tricarboxylate transporter receptor subunit TctC